MKKFLALVLLGSTISMRAEQSLLPMNVTVTELGGFYKRTPGTPLDKAAHAAIINEIPLRFAHAVAEYVQGGLAFQYPPNWFKHDPNVQVTLQHIRDLGPDSEMFNANIDSTASSAFQTIVLVTKLIIAANGSVKATDASNSDVYVNLRAEEQPSL